MVLALLHKHKQSHECMHSLFIHMRGCLLCPQRKLLKVCSIHTGGHQIIPLLKEESMTLSHQKTSPWCSQTGRALLSDLHFFVSVLQLVFFVCFFFFLNSAVWFGLQCAAGKSQWRCRPKQPGLKWLCECSVRDSFRACGKPAHSLLTVEMREWERGRER